MRKITFFKTMLVAIGLVVGSVSASAQILLEPFNYTPDGTLGLAKQSAGNWKKINTGDSILVESGNLNYAGFPVGTGNRITYGGAGTDYFTSFTSQTSGTVYLSFLLNISSLGTLNTTGGYNIGFIDGTTTNFAARTWIRLSGTNNFNIGINAGSSAGNTNWASNTLDINTTYLVVISYTINSGLANDVSKLWINPVLGNPSESTANATSTNTGATDDTSIQRVFIRQDSSNATPGTVVIDELRVSTSWLDVTPSSAAPLPVEMPNFSVASNNVITSQSVSLSCSTVGASIYYTLDNSDPNNTGNGTLYNGNPIAINATTTIKAIAYKSGITTSSIAIATYTFPTEKATLALLRSADVSGFYKVTGEAFATFKSQDGKTSYIQDASAGIVVYDGSGKITTPYNLGDGIKNIYCTLSLYFGTLELIPFNDPGAANSTGNTVTPKSINLTELNTGNYQGQLVTIHASITETGAFAGNTAYTINDGVTTGKLKVAYTGLDYIGKNIPSSTIDITGVVFNISVSEIDLVPRSSADFSVALSTGLDKTTITSKIYSSNGNVILSASANETVEIYNPAGQRLVSAKTVDGLNSIPVSARGIVFVKLGDKVTKVIL